MQCVELKLKTVMRKPCWLTCVERWKWILHFFFFYKFNINEESRLANFFWANSTTLMDNACFGDVLAFDTTYRTNAYKKPLVVLVGVNHHHQTMVSGCALLMDESIGTYEWVLETFLIATKCIHEYAY